MVLNSNSADGEVDRCKQCHQPNTAPDQTLRHASGIFLPFGQIKSRYRVPRNQNETATHKLDVDQIMVELQREIIDRVKNDHSRNEETLQKINRFIADQGPSLVRI